MKLNNNCMKHYENIADGMGNIVQIDDQIQISLGKIQGNRQILNLYRKEMIDKSRAIVKNNKRVNNIKQVIE